MFEVRRSRAKEQGGLWGGGGGGEKEGRRKCKQYSERVLSTQVQHSAILRCAPVQSAETQKPRNPVSKQQSTNEGRDTVPVEVALKVWVCMSLSQRGPRYRVIGQSRAVVTHTASHETLLVGLSKQLACQGVEAGACIQIACRGSRPFCNLQSAIEDRRVESHGQWQHELSVSPAVRHEHWLGCGVV